MGYVVEGYGTSASTTLGTHSCEFGVAELTAIVSEAVKEFEGVGADCVSREDIHRFLARVLGDMQNTAEIKTRLLAS